MFYDPAGLFEFDIQLPHNYPQVPPQFKLVTTNFGRVRFNPNLYSSGKVGCDLLDALLEFHNSSSPLLLQIFWLAHCDLTNIDFLVSCEQHATLSLYSSAFLLCYGIKVEFEWVFLHLVK